MTASIGRLHVITDEVLQDRFSHVELARMALDGGADVVQYREKRPVSDRDRLGVAEQIAAMCDHAGASLIVDDRVDIALAVGAGVHLGPTDVPVALARRLGVGVIGATANRLDMALAPGARDADYLGVGPVFGTSSKGAAPLPALGVDALRTIIGAVPIPVIAIGGVTPDAVPALIEAGVHGIAVLGGVCLAKDPTEATAAYAVVLGRAGRSA